MGQILEIASIFEVTKCNVKIFNNQQNIILLNLNSVIKFLTIILDLNYGFDSEKPLPHF